MYIIEKKILTSFQLLCYQQFLQAFCSTLKRIFYYHTYLKNSSAKNDVLKTFSYFFLDYFFNSFVSNPLSVCIKVLNVFCNLLVGKNNTSYVPNPNQYKKNTYNNNHVIIILLNCYFYCDTPISIWTNVILFSPGHYTYLT